MQLNKMIVAGPFQPKSFLFPYFSHFPSSFPFFSFFSFSLYFPFSVFFRVLFSNMNAEAGYLRIYELPLVEVLNNKSRLHSGRM